MRSAASQRPTLWFFVAALTAVSVLLATAWLRAHRSAVPLPPEIPSYGRPVDLETVIECGRLLLDTGTPYRGVSYVEDPTRFNPYPPFATVAFLPGVVLGLAATRVLLLAASLAALGLGLAFQLGGEGRPRAAILFGAFAVAGIVSYGGRFEYDRGQFNLVACALAWAGARWAVSDSRWRQAAGVVLFTAGVQLKIYPIVFVLLILTPVARWRARVPVLAAAAALNVAALFLLGPANTRRFLTAIAMRTDHAEVTRYNASITSFAGLVQSRLHWPATAGSLLAAGLAAVSLWLVWVVWRRAAGPGSPRLAAASTLLAIVLPPVSYDYKLSLLPWVAAGLLAGLGPDVGRRPDVSWCLALAGLMFGMLQVGWLWRPGLGPACSMALVLLACLAWLSRRLAADLR